jgi:Secretion system C-terminal sorting domain
VKTSAGARRARSTPGIVSALPYTVSRFDLGGSVAVSAAADDIDRDGQIELIVASGAGGGSIHCYKLYQSNYNTSELWWPMFRHDRARTGCYGAAVPTGVDETHNTAPSATRISSIYPNPFNPSTRVAFEVSTRAWVEVSIYDVSGRRVVVLLSKEMNPGRYDVAWFGQTSTGAVAASGVYFCKLRAGNVVETRKMVLLR